MRRFISILLNVGIFAVAILITVTISTLSLAQKVNQYNQQHTNNVTATVIKHEVNVIAPTQGFVKKIYVQEGDHVKKGQLLISMDNPSLRQEMDTLSNFTNNLSASTQLALDKEQLDSLQIKAPDDGVIGSVSVTEGNSYSPLTKVMTMYANSDTKVVGYLTVDQYQAMQRTHTVSAYSPRLAQSFTLIPAELKPAEVQQEQYAQKQIGIYFTFKDGTIAQDLLENEDVSIDVSNQQTSYATRPVAYIIEFWNGFLGGNNNE